MSQKDQPTNDAEQRDPPANSDDASAKAAEASLADQLQAAKADRDEHRDKWLRSEAELDNFRKRVRREAEEARKFQALDMSRELLPGLDNLDRAITAAEASGDVESLLQGIRMVSQQFREVFARNGVEPIDAEGKPFDPNLHEALQQVPTAEHPPMTVLQEVERGYKLHDRVVRPSKVIVATAPPAEANEDRG